MKGTITSSVQTDNWSDTGITYNIKTQKKMNSKKGKNKEMYTLDAGYFYDGHLSELLYIF